MAGISLPATEKMADKQNDGGGMGVRHVQCVALFFAMVLAFALRVNMSVAIVAMTDPQGSDTFDWSVQTQSVILSSFFWGYVILQIPAGILSAKFGGKILILIAIGVNTLATLAIPLGANYGGWQILCAFRVLQGLSQGFLYPSVHYLFGKWVPLGEKGRMSCLVYAGANVGTAVQMIVSGYIASAWGWPAIFYSTACVSALWTIVYWWIGSDSPQESKMISPEERAYIQTSLGHVGGHVKYPTPWRSIWTSLPFWALIIVHCGQNWGYWTLLTEIPSYMKQVLGVDIKSTGTLSALPYIGMYIASFPMGYIADLAVRRDWLSVTAVRKVSNSIAHWGPALALVALSYSPAGNLVAAVLLITVTVSLNAGQYSGFMLVHIDMAPNFAGQLMGITNSVANVVSIVAPLAVGFILEDETSAAQWRTVFFVSAGIYVIGNLFFVIFGTCNTQTWNEPKSRENKNSEGTGSDGSGLGIRHVQSVAFFFAMALAYALRVNMSVAIVAMTDSEEQDTFDWSIQIQSVILSSFFWGYIVLQVPAGVLAAKFGGKVLILMAMGVNTITTFAIPLGAHYGGWQLLCAFRVLQGLTQGFLLPSVYNLFSKWVPLEEKGRMSSLVFAGSNIGTAAQMIVSGYIASAWGWPAIFYSTACVSALWTAVYWWIGSDSPQESKMISPEERAYIQTSLGHVGGHVKYPTPWRAIWTSLPFWALIIVHCGQSWGYWTLVTEIPSYLKQVLGVDIKSTGTLSALPYIGMYVTSFPMGYLADLTVRRNWLSVTAVRKISNSVAHWGPALALVALSYSPADSLATAVILITVTVSLNAGQFTGFMLVHVDMAPNFAGHMFAITNSLGNAVSIVAPLAVGLILDDETSAAQWRTVFFVSAAIYFLGNLCFVIFGTCKRQSWNEPKPKNKKNAVEVFC